MEGRLFFISLWCGVYGLVLRWAFKHDGWFRGLWPTVVFNAFFWATVGFVAGMLRASYMAGMEFEMKYSFYFSGVGFLLGGTLGFFKGRREESSEKLLKDNLEWADTGFSAILLASVVMFFIVQAFKIPSGSMRTTFLEGDHLFVNKFIYGFPIPLTTKKILPLRKVKPGDIVIFRFPTPDKNNAHYGKDFIKRVVALEGQKLEIINKGLIVDGKKRDEPYKQHVDGNIYSMKNPISIQDFQREWETGGFSDLGGNAVRDNFGPVVVPAGTVFVMGDNRDRSYDGRFWGPLPLTAVKGRAWLLYWPLNRIRIAR